MKFSAATLPLERISEAVARQRVTGDSLECILYRYAPGATFAVHRHDAEQITLVLEGELHFTVEGEGEVVLTAGEAILIPSGRPHGAYVPATAAATRTVNVFTPVRSRPPDA